VGRLILVLWLYPLLEFAWMVIGLSRARWGSHHHRGSGATEAIIQITTVGNYETVNEIIKAVREYNLPFPYKFWVVVEPGVDNHYVDADEVIVVPEDFECFAAYKARAQEYSRRLRQLRGLDRHDVKIVMLDDDSLPTAKYFVDVYEADYDVCEGVLTPRRGYGRFLTHCDDLRTFSCLVVCSFWQGFGHPIWIHGEGLCLRGSAEAKVTWNFPVIASEDLTVGQNAVERELKWGFVWEYVQLTSPWTWSDFIKQRRRWIWGNIYALRHGLLPPFASGVIALRWVMGAITEVLVTAALVLVPLRIWQPSAGLFWVLLASLVAWLGTFVGACWIGSKDEGASVWKRIGNTIVGTLLAPVTSFLTFYVLILSIAKGDPKSFEVIAKSNPDSAVAL
jgi:hypothetical protein